MKGKDMILSLGEKLVVGVLGFIYFVSFIGANGRQILNTVNETIRKPQSTTTAQKASSQTVVTAQPAVQNQRETLIAQFREHVVSEIRKARKMNKASLLLLISALHATEYDKGFALWNKDACEVLGAKECYRIGRAACASMQFTYREAIELQRLSSMGATIEGYDGEGPAPV